jgi:predicted outer membrane repeat protein
MKKLTLFTAMLITANMLFAQIIHIPADYPTIQQGINAASDGDTVLVSPGTYVENLIIGGKNLTLASYMLTTQDTTYISQTIIDGNASGSVIAAWNIDSTTVICGFTITNGKSQKGGGVHLYKADANLEWLDVTMNVAEGWLSKAADGSDGIYSESILKHQKQRDDNPALGGGIYSEGVLRLTNSRVRNNWCQTEEGEITGRGGGIHICNVQGYNNYKIIVQDVEINNNQARVGGGVGINGGFKMIISNVNITNNIASSWGYDGYGGGIAYYDGGSDLFSEWTNVSISNNSAPYGGGIAFVDGGYSVTMVYQDISIEYNSATLSGGGIYLCENSGFEIGVWNLYPVVVKNIFINNNSSNLDGGGVYCEGHLTIDGSANTTSNIQINNNNCPGKGGGISFHNSETGFRNFKMKNITIQNNIAGSHGGGINTYKINSTFTNLLITGNSSGGSGGGIYTNKGK